MKLYPDPKRYHCGLKFTHQRCHSFTKSRPFKFLTITLIEESSFNGLYALSIVFRKGDKNIF